MFGNDGDMTAMVEFFETLILIDRRAAVWCACRSARTALYLVPPGEERPRKAIEMAEARIMGEGSSDACQRAADEASQVATAAEQAPDDGSAAAIWAAVHAARAAGSDENEPILWAAQGSAIAVYDEVRATEWHPGLRRGPSVPNVLERADEAARRHQIQLLSLLHEEPWPLTVPSPSQLCEAAPVIRAAWARVAGRVEGPQTIRALLEAHARAARLGLMWYNPVQRAVAERADGGTAPG
jgi:hypothetical protein